MLKSSWFLLESRSRVALEDVGSGCGTTSRAVARGWRALKGRDGFNRVDAGAPRDDEDTEDTVACGGPFSGFVEEDEGGARGLYELVRRGQPLFKGVGGAETEADV